MQNSSDHQTPGQPTTILIVEDEVIVRMVTVETLQDAGFKVLDAGDGNEALQHLHGDTQIDVLCSDVNLPDINGYALAAEAMKRHPALKVVVMTGYSTTPTPEYLKTAGARTLYKPFDLDELVHTVRDMTAHQTPHPPEPVRAKGETPA
jgi:DNA-binding NtrC family response regulator